MRSESLGFLSEVCSDFSGKKTDRAAAQCAVAFFGRNASAVSVGVIIYHPRSIQS